MSTYREVRLLSIAEAAYLAGLIDGEGTVTLSRKHAGDMRQLVVSISNTELPGARNGRYTDAMRAERRIFEDSLLGLRALRKKKPLQPCG
jgi:hypothetical protein